MNFTKVEVSNSIFTHATIYDKAIVGTTIPTEWNDDMVFNCDFKTLYAGDPIAYKVENVQYIVIKRQELVNGVQKWITLIKKLVTKPEDLIFEFTDYLNKNGSTYQYAIFEIDKQGIEGEYYTSNYVNSCFEKVIVASGNEGYDLTGGTVYNSYSRNQEVGYYTTFGRKYPIGVSNALVDYDSMTIEGYLIKDNKSEHINRIEQTKYEKDFKNFIVNKKPKIVKDYNGNLWVVLVSGEVSFQPIQEIGNTFPLISFSWVEIAAPDNEGELVNCGLLPISPKYE